MPEKERAARRGRGRPLAFRDRHRNPTVAGLERLRKFRNQSQAEFAHSFEITERLYRYWIQGTRKPGRVVEWALKYLQSKVGESES